MKPILTLLIAVIFYCCSSKEKCLLVINHEKSLYSNNIKYELKAIYEFDLDEESIYYIDYSQYIDTDTASYLTFLNTYNKSIYFYNCNNSDLHVKKIEDYNYKIPNEQIQGYYLLPNDSILLYSYYTGYLYGFYNSNCLFADKMNKVNESSFDNIYPYPYCSTVSPLMKYNNKIISCGWVTGETSQETLYNRAVVTIFDYKTKSFDFAVNYPYIYHEANWAGGFTYRMPYFDVNSQSIIISFSASHHLVCYSLDNKKETIHYAGSEKIDNIKSFPYPQDNPIDENEAWEWYMKTPSYEGIFYDQYRNMYYRIARLPSPKSFEEDEKNNKPIVIIVLDNNLQYLGETSLPTDIQFRPTNSFVSKEGFNIQVLTNNEDKLTFYQYIFTNEKD